MAYEIIGYTGMVLILFAFIMNQIHRWRDDSLKYDVVNAVGATVLIAYSFLIQSIPFLVLNGIWALVSLRDVAVDVEKLKGKRVRKPRGHVGHKRR